ncbi:hypothetical protein KY328_05030 [Candidatus Woesearchaeota archaeon]|nr:hypothetical protein [Candidatus Woesearchaeota archaeon]MBW3022262.1 hypothetical protein [Candidatus Woesearchaeota archaeon]
MADSIHVKCRRCGKTAPASEFVLDHVYRLMVCPHCVKERKNSEAKKTKIVEPENKISVFRNRPPGWDEDDEYLERAQREKQIALSSVRRELQVHGDKVNYKCFKCKYVFVYNKAKHYPNVCPNCGSGIINI